MADWHGERVESITQSNLMASRSSDRRTTAFAINIGILCGPLECKGAWRDDDRGNIVPELDLDRHVFFFRFVVVVVIVLLQEDEGPARSTLQNKTSSQSLHITFPYASCLKSTHIALLVAEELRLETRSFVVVL